MLIQVTLLTILNVSLLTSLVTQQGTWNTVTESRRDVAMCDSDISIDIRRCKLLILSVLRSVLDPRMDDISQDWC